MADNIIKLVVLLKKNPGITDEAFRAYYESTHCKLVRLVPRVERYFRRYLKSLDAPLPDGETAVQVITELWFRNQADFDFAMAEAASPEVRSIIAADEERLFDCAAIRTYVIVEEGHSDLAIDMPS